MLIVVTWLQLLGKKIKNLHFDDLFDLYKSLLIAASAIRIAFKAAPVNSKKKVACYIQFNNIYKFNLLIVDPHKQINLIHATFDIYFTFYLEFEKYINTFPKTVL